MEKVPKRIKFLFQKLFHDSRNKKHTANPNPNPNPNPNHNSEVELKLQTDFILISFVLIVTALVSKIKLTRQFLQAAAGSPTFQLKQRSL